MIKEYSRILIVRLDRIGDVVLSTPVFHAVRAAYPKSHIAVMVQPHAEDLVKGSPDINEVILYHKDGGVAKNISFINDLRNKRFDLAIILHPTTRTHALMRLAGIRERVGYDKKWGFLLTKRIPHTKESGQKHESEYSLDMLRHIGIEVKERDLFVPIQGDSEKRIEALFLEHGIVASDRVVVVHPGASCASKRWGAQRFAEVSDRLVRDSKAKIIIIAGPQDYSFGNDVASKMKEKNIDLSAKTSVGDIASILKRSKLFISNDSGPVHIASALKIPAIVIFGRSDAGLSPKRWGPIGKNNKVFHKNIGCGICLAHNCEKGFKCLESVTVDEVADAAKAELK